MIARTHDPWVRYRDTSLYAIPSVHYRQTFAQLVFQACYQKKFDVIAVELPPSYQQFGIIDAALRLGPAPGIVIHPTGGKTQLMEVPVRDDPKCTETELRPVKKGIIYPFTPCDSIVAALRAPQLLGDRWPGWTPEVALIDAEYRFGERPWSSLPYRDDYEVMVNGLSAFIGRLEAESHAARCLPVDAHREKVMGSRLRQFLDAGKEVLFVCGAAHWRSICEYLDSGVRERLEPFAVQRAPRLLLAALQPATAWLWGWLDDIPRVLWELELCNQRGRVLDYDKRQEIQNLVAGTFEQARKEQIPTSIRRMLTMARLTETLTGVAGRWSPELDDHLVPLAAACVEPRFAELLKKRALEFPAPLPEGCEFATVLPYKDGSWFIKVEDEVFLLQFPKSEGKKTRRVSIEVPRPLTEEEKASLDEEPLCFRDWPQELELLYMMDARARDLARKREHIAITRRFTGSMADGPDWRRTIRARAAGEKGFYVRQMRPHVRKSGAASPLITPVVWIFEQGMDVELERYCYALLENGDEAVSGFEYTCETSKLAEGRIKVSKRAAFTDIGYSRAFCGQGRPGVFDGARERQVDTAYFMSIPDEKRCDANVWGDEELAPFVGTDHAIAAAIKYANSRIILISRSALPVSAAIQRYAEQRNVMISRISIDCFEPRRLERLRWSHWVPAPDGDVYARPYEWCSRFVPPI